MTKVIFLLIIFLATECLAGEIPLGIASNRNCALSAQYESSPLDQRGQNVVLSCAIYARDKMNLREIGFDPIQASPVFQQILQDCVSSSAPTIKIFAVILRSKGSCAR